MAIELTKETRDRLIASIKRCLTEELELPGNSQAARPRGEQPEVTRRGLPELRSNSQAAQPKGGQPEIVGEIDGTCYEPEFGYWKR